MAGGQGLAEIGIGAEVERRLALLVLELEVGAVGREEAGDEGAALLVLALGAQAHEQTADVLDVLELAQLGERVVAQGLVQRRVAVLVRHVQVRALAHQQLRAITRPRVIIVFSFSRERCSLCVCKTIVRTWTKAFLQIFLTTTIPIIHFPFFHLLRYKHVYICLWLTGKTTL